MSRSEIRFRTVSWDFAVRSERLLRPSQGVVIACLQLMRGVFDLLTVLVRADLSKDVEL